ncbi:flagellar biosynthetic protein FliR [Paracoccus sp. Z118]|uniref:flagellar biosynthetic protein FliR n=1 Tax=Paracoccus sp. Z118 TaxID=2851017 RepID=UPI001C2BAF73|nr:flagellar biosynthetic protein FliR [Paracoccus sp. Z118]MBV0890755.1 flagellar biosynthetic protein FliR [Paracoccus sp. Z118]
MTFTASALLPLILVYARVQACLLALPGFGEQPLPVRVRVALAFALTPLLAGTTAAPDAATPGALGLLVAAEIVTGAALGLMVRLIAMALDIGATAIAQTASLSQILGVSNEMAPHPIGNLLHLAGLAVLMALGLPIMVCDLLSDSLRLRPAGGWPDIQGLLPAIVELVRSSFSLALVIAAPFVLGGFLFQALSGVIARVMPALPVVFIAAPAAILLALVALTVMSPAILRIWADAVLSVPLPVLP